MPREKNGNPKNPRERGKWKPKGGLNIPQLPQALVMDILSRLSIKTIYNCRCVCKEWLHIISDPQFAQLHCLRSPISILMRTLPRAVYQRKLGLIQIEKCAGSRMRVERMRFAPKNSLPVGAGAASEIVLINSCNGLVFMTFRDGCYYVCNPILGEYIRIPSPDMSPKSWSMCFVALGFSARTNEYKVLRTDSSDEAWIYTIGTGVWRNIGEAPYCCVRLPFNSFLHEALHWVPTRFESFDGPQFIHSFNFEREQFRPLPPPSTDHLKVSRYGNYVKLGVLKGCLFLCVFGAYNSEFDMWVMKDYGVQESWTKILVFENMYPLCFLHDVYEPIAFSSDGEILMIYKNRVVVRYNQETKTLSKTGIIQTQSRFHAIAYRPCFVSLHDVSNGEEVIRVRDNNKFEELFVKGSYDCAGSSKSPIHKPKKLKSGSGQPAFGECLPNKATSSSS